MLGRHGACARLLRGQPGIVHISSHIGSFIGCSVGHKSGTRGSSCSMLPSHPHSFNTPSPQPHGTLMRNIRSHGRLRTTASYFSQSDDANLRRSVGSLGECRIERNMLQSLPPLFQSLVEPHQAFTAARVLSGPATLRPTAGVQPPNFRCRAASFSYS